MDFLTFRERMCPMGCFNTNQVLSGISSIEELKTIVCERLKEVDLNQKKRDFVHLLFNESNADRIMHFAKVVSEL